MNLKPLDHLVSDLLAGDTPTIELRGHSYEDHGKVIPILLDAVAACGCWVLEHRALSPTMTELRLEVQLRSVFELYGTLISSGVQLTRDSHTCMIGLCTVRDHNPRRAKRRRILTIRLELSFLEDGGSELGRMAAGHA
jgi:hypothetical protein